MNSSPAQDTMPFMAEDFPEAGKQKTFVAIALVLAIKIVTWGAGLALSHAGLTFNESDYLHQFHHFRIDDPVAGKRERSFWDLWNFADSEWYLSIAATGYPTRKQALEGQRMPALPFRYTEKDSFLKYAFFPLFPVVISVCAPWLGVEPAAFLITLIAGLAAAAAFVFLFGQAFPRRHDVQIYALLLLFLYPFSVFYNLYHSESLFLLLSLLCFIALRSGRYFLMMLLGFLLCLTRPNGMFITVPLLYGIHQQLRSASATPQSGHRARYLFALAIPLGVLPYVFLNRRNMGDWLFFSTVQSSWGNAITSISLNLWTNLVSKGIHFFSLQFHRFHSSQLDYVVTILLGIGMIAMWRDREFPRDLTLWAGILWIVPLLSKDLMSVSRYSCSLFPVFMFLALKFGPRTLRIILAFFTAGYFLALTRVVQYGWLG